MSAPRFDEFGNTSSPSATWWQRRAQQLQQQQGWVQTPAAARSPAIQALSDGTPSPVQQWESRVLQANNGRAVRSSSGQKAVGKCVGKEDQRLGLQEQAGSMGIKPQANPQMRSPSARATSAARSSARFSGAKPHTPQRLNGQRSQSVDTLSSPEPVPVRRALREALDDVAGGNMPMKSPLVRTDRSMPSSSVWLPMSAKAGSPSGVRVGSPSGVRTSSGASTPHRGYARRSTPNPSGSPHPACASTARLQRSPQASSQSPWAKSPFARESSPLSASPPACRRGAMASRASPQAQRSSIPRSKNHLTSSPLGTTPPVSACAPSNLNWPQAMSGRTVGMNGAGGGVASSHHTGTQMSSDARLGSKFHSSATSETNIQQSSSSSPLFGKLPSAPEIRGSPQSTMKETYGSTSARAPLSASFTFSPKMYSSVASELGSACSPRTLELTRLPPPPQWHDQDLAHEKNINEQLSSVDAAQVARPYPSPGAFQKAVQRATGLNTCLRKDLLDVLGEIRLGVGAPVPPATLGRRQDTGFSNASDVLHTPCGSDCSSSFSSPRSSTSEMTSKQLIDASASDWLLGKDLHGRASASACPGSPTMSDMDAALESMPTPRLNDMKLPGPPQALPPPPLPLGGSSSSSSSLLPLPPPPFASQGAMRVGVSIVDMTADSTSEPFQGIRGEDSGTSYASIVGSLAAARKAAMAAARDRYKVTVGASSRSGQFRSTMLRELDSLSLSPSSSTCPPSTVGLKLLAL